MNLGTLLQRLRPLVADPRKNWDAIVKLLEDHADLAEYQVARHFVQHATEPLISEMMQDVDPVVRRRAIAAMVLIYPRRSGGKLLRRMVKDPDLGTRLRARSAVGMLGLDDVALRDTRYREPARQSPTIRGGYNPTGWNFGLDRRGKRAKGLAALKLPKLSGPEAVAELVGLDDASQLVRLTRPGSGKGAPYVEFEIPKRDGSKRLINAPRAPLKAVQRALLDKILDRIPAHDAAHGFVRGRSVVTNAEPHVGARLVVKFDLKDFFPSIHFRRVEGLFRHYGYNEEVARLLASLTTHRPVLPDGRVVWPGVVPQGAPTSPALANALCRRLDARLSGLASQVGARYTRYADDLTFSFADQEPRGGLGHFLWWVDQVCQQEGFCENPSKRRVLRPCNQQRVTGIVVNSGLFVPRRARRRFRAMLHNCRARGIKSEARGDVAHFRDYLRGFAAYVEMVQPERGARLVKEVNALLESAD